MTIELSNVYLLSDIPILFKKFKSIGHQTHGDKASFECFDLISKHLLNKIGDPKEKQKTIEEDREITFDT